MIFMLISLDLVALSLTRFLSRLLLWYYDFFHNPQDVTLTVIDIKHISDVPTMKKNLSHTNKKKKQTIESIFPTKNNLFRQYINKQNITK